MAEMGLLRHCRHASLMDSLLKPETVDDRAGLERPFHANQIPDWSRIPSDSGSPASRPSASLRRRLPRVGYGTTTIGLEVRCNSAVVTLPMMTRATAPFPLRPVTMRSASKRPARSRSI